jgi:DNA repair and recombination protein RAD52
MAGAFSGHLLGSFDTANHSRVPFGQSHISTHGAISFNPQMHGSQPFDNSESISDATTIKINALQAKLNQKLGPEYISQRPGPGGGKLTYAEGWKIINLANEVFGFNGWSSNIVSLTTDYIDFSEESKKFNVGVTAIVRVTLRDGVFHEDIGYGILENSKSKGAALDKVCRS